MYLSEANPTTATILIIAGDQNAVAGTEMIVDELEFIDVIAGLTEQKTSDAIQVSPNPANDLLNISVNLDHQSKMNIAIYDIQGKVVCTSLRSDLMMGEQRVQLPISNYPSGLYMYAIETSTGILHGKFTVIHE